MNFDPRLIKLSLFFINYILIQRCEVGAGRLCLPCSFEEQAVAIVLLRVCVRYFLYDSF